MRPFLHAADRLRAAGPGIEGDRRSERALHQAQRSGGAGRGVGPMGGLPPLRAGLARRGGQCPPPCDDQGAAHRPLPKRTIQSASSAAHPLRHRRDSLCHRHSSCPHPLRRQSLLRAAGVGPQAGRAASQRHRGADRISGPGDDASYPLLREGPVARPSRGSPSGPENAETPPGRRA